jgi:hypothetical protein
MLPIREQIERGSSTADRSVLPQALTQRHVTCYMRRSETLAFETMNGTGKHGEATRPRNTRRPIPLSAPFWP